MRPKLANYDRCVGSLAVLIFGGLTPTAIRGTQLQPGRGHNSLANLPLTFPRRTAVIPPVTSVSPLTVSAISRVAVHLSLENEVRNQLEWQNEPLLQLARATLLQVTAS